MKKLLDLGCGKSKKNINGYSTIGVDISKNSSADVICKLGFERINLDDDSIDYVTAIQLFEHIPRFVYQDNEIFNPFIYLMNEIYRVMRDGATLEVHVPIPGTKQFLQDPTHLNPIIDESWIYFEPEDRWGVKDMYGINSSFILVGIEKISWYKVYKLRSIKSTNDFSGRITLPRKLGLVSKLFNSIILRA